MKRKPAAKEARGCEKKPKTGNNSSNGAQSGRNGGKVETYDIETKFQPLQKQCVVGIFF